MPQSNVVNMLTYEFPPHIHECAHCKKHYIKQDKSVPDGYCSYECGVYAQPEATVAAIWSTGSKKDG